MRSLLLVAVTVALVAGTAGAAPVPVETRTQAVLELQAAIEDEERALELLAKDPPRFDTADGRLRSARQRLSEIKQFLSSAPGAGVAEAHITEAWTSDSLAIIAPYRQEMVAHIKYALRRKRAALPLVRAAQSVPAVSQCSDAKDNDGDGITDWKLEPGCTSSRDVRESSPFSCGVDSSVASGRLVLSGSCSGAFSEVEFTLLDGLQLNGRFDIKHAPSCAPPTVTVVRCSTKTADQNPEHLVEARFTTTKRTRGQRVRMRFFDQRKRQIRNFTVPVR